MLVYVCRYLAVGRHTCVKQQRQSVDLQAKYRHLNIIVKERGVEDVIRMVILDTYLDGFYKHNIFN